MLFRPFNEAAMTDTTSSQAAGIIPPLTPVADDDELIDLYQPVVAQIAGMDGALVRPRWQDTDTPNQPQYETGWISLGIKNARDDTYQWEAHVDNGGDDLGLDVFEYSEEIDLLISCYGPDAQKLSRRLRDGFRIEQNRAPLQALNTDVLFVGNSVVLPMLLHGKWLRRVDLTVMLRRYVSVQYAIRTIVGLPDVMLEDSATSTIDNELYKEPFSVSEPAT